MDGLVVPRSTNVAPVVVLGVTPAPEWVYLKILFWPLELVPSDLASDQLVADELIKVEPPAATEAEAPEKPAGAVSPAEVVDITTMTHRTAVAPSTLDPAKV